MIEHLEKSTAKTVKGIDGYEFPSVSLDGWWVKSTHRTTHKKFGIVQVSKIKWDLSEAGNYGKLLSEHVAGKLAIAVQSVWRDNQRIIDLMEEAGEASKDGYVTVPIGQIDAMFPSTKKIAVRDMTSDELIGKIASGEFSPEEIERIKAAMIAASK